MTGRCIGRAGFPPEADSWCRGEAEDAVYHLGAEWVLRDWVRTGEGRWEGI